MASPTAAAVRALDAFNRRWTERRALARRLLPPPWWAPGLRLTAEIRARYEALLPAAAWGRELAGVLAWWLPAPEWVPRDLVHAPYASLPDLWEQLPAPLAGRVAVPPAALLPMACAVAAPARHGTRAGRYGEQAAFLRQYHDPLRAADLGCGTGQGTWELADALPPGSSVTGITREPLEAWMARRRCLPHYADAWRPRPDPFAFPPRPPDRAVDFLAADLREWMPPAPLDLVVCNGVIGGPDFRRPRQYRGFWQQAARWLRPGAVLLIADRFHAGRDPAVTAFAAAASAAFRPLWQAGRSHAWQRH